MIDKIISAVTAPNWVEWAALGFNLAYIWLAAREDARCWIFGFIGTIATFVVSLEANLKSDAALQVYYAGSAIYGWLSWRGEFDNQQSLHIKQIPLSMHAYLVAIGLLTGWFLGNIWHSAAWRYEDAILTSFSIITTFLTARKILESWLYWIVIDAAYILIYGERGMYLLALLSVIYTIVSIRGYFVWRKKITLVSSQ